jgi:hypothetical protein
MVNPLSQSNLESPVLMRIREDMDVFDRDGEKIGEVEDIYFGSVGEAADDFGQGPASTNAPRDPLEGSWLDNLAEAFAGEDDMPETLRDRLLRSGFIRIDGSGLFASDYYAMPEQIASVADDRVQLNVKRDDLIKR